ncbi:MAG: hypothetical protein Q8L53_16235 [Aestuariivirga sp.]|nr:hypothetical protein [Aestuariivirga sp.]
MITTSPALLSASDLDRAPPQKTVESVLRKALKISDPANVEELSRGLLLRYGKDALLMDRERKGLPFSVVIDAVATTANSTGTRPEIVDAQIDLERVLAEIASDPALAEINAEMRGWARAIRAAAADGLNAARFALDPQSSDRAMTARRTLGDYARVSRYAAALATCSGGAFCRLAQACDAIASLILVILGDGLADAGVTRSTHIPRVPAATLRQRRDTVINELQLLHRNSSGASSLELWPRGIVSLVQIHNQLETSDTADLRSLLDEGYLSRQLDDLLDLAADNSADGLKALGSVASMSVRRFRRFISVVSTEISPPSPPLARFIAALSYFVQGFAVSAGGYRLPFLARSPLLAGQSSLVGGSDEPVLTLIQTALARSAAAEWIDCLCCSCDEDDAQNIIFFSKLVYDLDRAIDLYAFGTDPLGKSDAEVRAAAYGAIIEAVDAHFKVLPVVGSAKFKEATTKIMTMAPGLVNWTAFLKIADSDLKSDRAQMMHDMLCYQLKEERASARLVSSIAPICRRQLILDVLDGKGIAKLIEEVQEAIAELGEIKHEPCSDAEMKMPPDFETAQMWMTDDADGIGINLLEND